MNSWEELKQECLQCHACSLAETRTNVVFGVGTPQAEVVIVGEAPGANEDKQGEPFVGRAGKLLDDMLAMIGLDRSRIYITNSVKCRPPQNRDPLNTEKEACSGYLRRQMELMQPMLVLPLVRGPRLAGSGRRALRNWMGTISWPLNSMGVVDSIPTSSRQRMWSR